MTYLNMQIIEELREILGEDLDPIARTFLDSLDGQAQDIRDCFATGDLTALAPIAHAFKGGAANMGAERLAESAAAIERHARAGEGEHIAPLIDGLPDLVRQTLAAYRAIGFA